MKRRRLSPPAGAAAYLLGEATRRRAVEERIVEGLRSAGFREAMVPAADYLGPYLPHLDAREERELYRFTDRHGDTLALRADFTIALARHLAPRLPADGGPVRVFYRGEVLRGGTRDGATAEFYQIGAELVGDASDAADVALAEHCREALAAGGVRPGGEGVLGSGRRAGAEGGVKLEEIRFDGAGLVPIVVRDAVTGAVAMLAWGNREAVARTLATREATFWSRSRKALWVKGEASGHRMEVLGVVADCDLDALLYEARLSGPACHTGSESCFHRPLAGEPSERPRSLDLAPLFAVLESRFRERPAGSYSAKIFDRGLDHILKKVGEEASEVIVAMKNPDEGAVAGEIADLLFHLAAAMTARGIGPDAVNAALASRRKDRS